MFCSGTAKSEQVRLKWVSLSITLLIVWSGMGMRVPVGEYCAS
jgi:hypothetical protein